MHSILASGFSLLEVLVSLFILSLALLGLDMLEYFTLHESLRTYQLSVAGQQLYNMQQRLCMLAKQDGLNQQISIWQQQNKQILPYANNSIEGNYPTYTITLCIGEPPACLKENITC